MKLNKSVTKRNQPNESNLFDIPNRKSFDQLVEEKANCFEMGMNGYVRIYEEGEKLCECEYCNSLRDWNKDIDRLYGKHKI